MSLIPALNLSKIFSSVVLYRFALTYHIKISRQQAAYRRSRRWKKWLCPALLPTVLFNLQYMPVVLILSFFLQVGDCNLDWVNTIVVNSVPTSYKQHQGAKCIGKRRQQDIFEFEDPRYWWRDTKIIPKNDVVSLRDTSFPFFVTSSTPPPHWKYMQITK